MHKATRTISALGHGLLATAVVMLLAAGAPAGEFAYSFQSGAEGGAAVLRVDPTTGAISDHRAPIRDAAARNAKKVRFTADGAYLALTVETDQSPNLFVAPFTDTGAATGVSLPGVPDELRAVGGHMLVSCSSGTIALVDTASAQLINRFEARTMHPPGRAGEDVFVLPDGRHAVISFQKDHRLAILTLPDLTLVANLALPAQPPGHQFPEVLLKKGPEPEVVLVAPAANTLLVTLDNTGAVGLLDWAKALKGDSEGMRYVSTALDGSWGTAFPDRAELVEIGGRIHALVTNVGEAGGAVLIDLHSRRIVQTWDVPHGLEKPVILPGRPIAVAAPTGKLKSKTAGRTFIPGDALYVFDLRPNAPAPALATIPLGIPTLQVAAVAPTPGSPPRPLVVVGGGEVPHGELLVVDLAERRIVAREPALGMIQRIEARPATPGLKRGP